MAGEKEGGGSTHAGPDITGARSEGGTDITGGTDKYGKGGLATPPDVGAGDTGIRETGDIMGASSTLAGAGGEMENTGGVGTAPTSGGRTRGDS
jgi:hypothetical protein